MTLPGTMQTSPRKLVLMMIDVPVISPDWMCIQCMCSQSCTSAAEMKPLPSLSNTLKASFNSSSESESCRNTLLSPSSLPCRPAGRSKSQFSAAWIARLHLASHKVEELWKVDRAIAVSIDLINHVLQFCLGWVLAERPHDGAKLFGGDGA